MRIFIFFILLLRGSVVNGQDKSIYIDTIQLNIFSRKIDSFINTLPIISLNTTAKFLNQFEYSTSQKGLVMVDDIRTGRTRILSAYESINTPESKLQILPDNYYVKNKEALYFAQYMSDVSLTYDNDYVYTTAFDADKRHLDSLISFEKSDTVKAFYHCVLGRIYIRDKYESPINKGSAYYHFNRGRFYIENYKITPNILTNEAPHFSEKEKELKYPNWSDLLNEMYHGVTKALHNSTNIDPDNIFKRLLEERNYFLYISEVGNNNDFKLNKIEYESYLWKQQESLRLLTDIYNDGISTVPDSLLTKAFVADMLAKRIPYFGKTQDRRSEHATPDFYTLYYIANYLYNNKDYERALKVYLYAIEFKEKNYIPNRILYYERDALFRMTFFCCKHLNIIQEELDVFYTAIKNYKAKYRLSKPLVAYDFILNEYQLGFDEVIEALYYKVKKDNAKATERIYTYLISAQNLIASNPNFNLVKGPFIDNIVFAGSLLSREEKEYFYFTYFKNRKKKIPYDVYFEALLLSKGLYNGSPNIDLYKQAFESAQDKIAGELNLEIQTQLKNEKEFTNLLRVILGLIVLGILVYILIKVFKRQSKKHKEIQSLFNKEKDIANLLHENIIHNWNSDQKYIANFIHDSRDVIAIAKMQEKHTEYMESANRNWLNQNVSISEAIVSVQKYYNFLSLRYPKLAFDCTYDLQNIKPEKVAFISSIFETFLHNSLSKGFEYFSKRKDIGEFKIKISRDDKFLYCLINDNGTPRRSIKDYFTGEKHGITLSKKRVELKYELKKMEIDNDAFRIKIKSGTLIMIKIPYEEIENISS